MIKLAIREKAGIALRKCKTMLYKALWVFPMKNTRIVFQSYENAIGYLDNPKYLCEYIHNNLKYDFETVFVLNRDCIAAQHTNAAKTVSLGSFRCLYYMATAKVIVINVRTKSFLTRRKGQLVINTWHAGGAYKTTGKAADNMEHVHAWREEQRRKFINLFISSSRVFTEKNIVEGMRYTGPVLNCGMPRNDFLFDLDATRAASERVHNTLGLGNELVVLYAPTYRGITQKHNDIQKIDFRFPLEKTKKAIEQRMQRKVVFLVRKHHHDQNMYDYSGSMTDVSDYPDMQELLCATDILITDYSSSIWDFAILRRPCFLFVPDIDEYENERGFFTSPADWPGIICRTEEELCQELEHIEEERSKEIAEKHFVLMGSYEEGTSCEQIMDYIQEYTSMA